MGCPDATMLAMRNRSKTLATWLAVVGGSLGLHRFYLHGAKDVWAWLHPWPTLLGLAGVIRMRGLGQYLMILAFSKAPASTVSPYLYTSIAFATLAGWFVFGQIPDALASLGMLVIAVCGLGAGWLSVKEQGAQSKELA